MSPESRMTGNGHVRFGGRALEKGLKGTSPAPHPTNPLPPPADYSPCAWDEHGRGLVIVKTLSHRWGTTPAANGGKHVYATLRTSPELPAQQDHEDGS